MFLALCDTKSTFCRPWLRFKTETEGWTSNIVVIPDFVDIFFNAWGQASGEYIIIYLTKTKLITEFFTC